MTKYLFLFLCIFIPKLSVANPYDNPDTLVVARDGTGQFRNVSEAIEVCRAFMDYHKVIYIKKVRIKRSSSFRSGYRTSSSVVRIETRPSSRGTTMPILMVWAPSAPIPCA